MKRDEEKKTENNSVSSKSKNKLSNKERFELGNLEKEIKQLEQEQNELTDKLQTGTGTHHELHIWGLRLTEIIKISEEKTMRWLELSELNNA